MGFSPSPLGIKTVPYASFLYLTLPSVCYSLIHEGILSDGSQYYDLFIHYVHLLYHVSQETVSLLVRFYFFSAAVVPSYFSSSIYLRKLKMLGMSSL